MTESIFYELLWVVIIFLWLRYSRSMRAQKELGLLLQYGFLLKVAFGFFFIYIYTDFYGSGNLSSDASGFMKDSKILNDVFYASRSAYFSFMTGIGDTTEMVHQYLINTSLWSRGENTLFNDSQNVIRINSLIHFISRGNPHIHVIFMSLFSILGLRDLAIAFRKKIPVDPRILFAGLILMPSILFWSSGILKEPFLILGIGILMRGLMADETRWKKALRFAAGFVILTCIKPYVLICLLAALAFYALSTFLFKNRQLISLAVFAALISVFLAVPKFRNELTENLSIKQHDSNNVGKGGLYAVKDTVLFYYFNSSDLHKLKFRDSTVELTQPVHATQKWVYKTGKFEPVYLTPNREKWKVYLLLDSSNSLIRTTPINNSFGQLVRNVPEAFVNALLRPFPSDSGSLLIYPAILEVFVCMGILLLAVIYRRKLSDRERTLLFTLIVFTVAMLVLIGWTTPIIGAIVRYRIPAYMAIFIISIFITRIPEKWKRTDP